MVGLIILVALLAGAASVGVLTGKAARLGRLGAGALGLLLFGLMTRQLATEPSGLGRLGWTNVRVEAGRAGQVLVVAMLAVLVVAAGLELLPRRSGTSKTLARVASSLGLAAAAGSLVTAYTCFIE